jgi:hypothetical protein
MPSAAPCPLAPSWLVKMRSACLTARHYPRTVRLCPFGAASSLATLEDAVERPSTMPATPVAGDDQAHAAGWRDLLAFCVRRGELALPATDETVAGYLAELGDAGLMVATIARRLVARHDGSISCRSQRTGPITTGTTTVLRLCRVLLGNAPERAHFPREVRDHVHALGAMCCLQISDTPSCVLL